MASCNDTITADGATSCFGVYNDLGTDVVCVGVYEVTSDGWLEEVVP